MTDFRELTSTAIGSMVITLGLSGAVMAQDYEWPRLLMIGTHGTSTGSFASTKGWGSVVAGDSEIQTPADINKGGVRVTQGLSSPAMVTAVHDALPVFLGMTPEDAAAIAQMDGWVAARQEGLKEATEQGIEINFENQEFFVLMAKKTERISGFHSRL